MKTHTGKVIWFDDAKGYGYLAVAPSLKLELGIPAANDLFVHRHDIVRSPRILRAEEKVSFEVRTVTGKGPRAASVHVIEKTAGVPALAGKPHRD